MLPESQQHEAEMMAIEKSTGCRLARSAEKRVIDHLVRPSINHCAYLLMGSITCGSLDARTQ